MTEQELTEEINKIFEWMMFKNGGLSLLENDSISQRGISYKKYLDRMISKKSA